MLNAFFNSRSFVVVCLLPQGTTFNAAFFIAQVIAPLHQLHSLATADETRRTVPLHFDNSPCDTTQLVTDDITLFRCQRVPYPPYSLDLARKDFCLFGRMNERLIGITAINAHDLRN
jgi:hypothetical protein